MGADGKLLALPLQAAASTTALATKFGAEITVVGKFFDLNYFESTYSFNRDTR